MPDVDNVAEGRDCQGEADSLAGKAYQGVKSVWKYAGRVITTFKLSLRSYAHSHPKEKTGLLAVANKLSALSIMTVLLNPGSIVSECQDIAAAQSLGDSEGVGLASLSVLTLSGDTLDSWITFSTSLENLGVKMPVPSWFGAALLPIAFILCGLTIVNKGVKIHSSRTFLNKLEEIDKGPEYEKVLKEFLNEALGMTDKEIQDIGDDALELEKQKEKKRLEKKLIRVTSKKEVDCLKELRESEFDKKKAKKLLGDMKMLQERKVVARWCSIASLLATIVALSLFYITPISSAVPFGLLAALAVIKLGILIYENKFMDDGLTFAPQKPKQLGVEGERGSSSHSSGVKA